ncbi:preprotein translocase subunit SecA [Haliovirga abyssi]|uniref:Protein translocase subunit SecA n=1 Tax=Haliovirga abyssi TaxID=2996794 RepID=A0AAU9DXA9_9FUSO|nr:preprotein translocase subunit SecA [Haliovirga abyssi]BDU51061.1 protein translocase subunit SecA [Haliovirga abyssi]
MLKKMLGRIIGTKNEREIKRMLKKVEKINELEPQFQALSDEQLKAKTVEFREKLANGETLDDILAEAFAVVREAGKRVLGMRHYDVQMVGGIVLHEGKIAEMKTGEGKTLVATLPVYLNALTGKGVHLVTVNDYLAKRDKEWMGKIYEFLGLKVGVILNGLENDERKEAYDSDITYGTNNEFGFDYLRDNMTTDKGQKVQRELNYAIVDEVDSILIDEARTPLIISGAAEETTKWYKIFADISIQVIKGTDYEVDEKAHSTLLTDVGIKKVEKILKIDNLYSPENVELTHYLNQALRAKELFKRDKDYIVKDGEVVIVDEFTGRLMSGRRYSEGLHQAIEAKEGVDIAGENQTLATITLQNYFRMYTKLSGMTGTAETEAGEFMHIYKLPIIIMPTNKPIARKDNPDLVFKTKREKIDAIVNRIIELYKKGQPTLVGTASIDSSEELSAVLKAKKIPHSVLNAKHHEKEAEIVAQAGRYGAVTIATNMAGRGTDIVLGGNPEFMAKLEAEEGTEEYEKLLKKHEEHCSIEKEKVLAAGGLFILGTERHESRRIDNQLRGRSGRQGDPGATEFYLSLEDELMRLFGSDKVRNVMERLGLPEGEPIFHPMITKAIENAQKKVEARNFSVRKQLLEYDDVMNQQREIIYDQRNKILEKDNLKSEVLNMLKSTSDFEATIKLTGETPEEWDVEGLKDRLYELYEYDLNIENIKEKDVEDIKNEIYSELVDIYESKEKEFTEELMRRLEKYIMIEILDGRWRENLQVLDSLKEGINLRAYGQKDPVVEYKILSSEIYSDMIKTVKEETTSYLFKIKVEKPDFIERQRVETPMYYNTSEDEEVKKKPIRKTKVGRNDPCPCGSGKKYKNCCGR